MNRFCTSIVNAVLSAAPATPNQRMNPYPADNLAIVVKTWARKRRFCWLRAASRRQSTEVRDENGMHHAMILKDETDGSNPAPYTNARIGRAATMKPTASGRETASRYLMDFSRITREV